MPRIRTLKPDFWSDSKMVKLSPFARLLYIGSWNFALCDRGHLPDDVEDLKLKVLPADDVDAEALLEELVRSGRVTRHTTADGRSYLHVVRLSDHQKVDGRWQPRCPYCAAENSPDHPPPRPASPKLPETPRTTPKNTQESKGREGKVTPPPTPSPPVDGLEELDLEDYRLEQRLIAEVLELRPEWSASSVERVLRDPEILARPWPIVSAALLIVARDPESSVPGRVRADGPWWAEAAGARASPQQLDPPCGECGPNRMVDHGDHMTRCQKCHPLRGEQAS